MPITTLAGLKAAIEIAQAVRFNRSAISAEGAGTYGSYWKSTGRPAAGSTPPAYGAGTDYRPNSATIGALPMVNAVSGKELILPAAQLIQTTFSGMIVLYDRLWACSGFSTDTISTQTIVTPETYPVNRGAANGSGVELWLECYATPGAGGATWTINFQDQVLGGVQSATYSHPSNAETVGQMMPVIMADGAASVYYPIDFTCSSASGAAGDIGITLLRRISSIPCNANVDTWMGFLETGLAKIENNACLAFMVQCTASAAGALQGMLLLADN